MPNTAIWIDTGFLVALFAKKDAHHASAKAFIKEHKQLDLHAVWPVVVEACFFLNANAKQALLQWIERGAVIMHDFSIQDLPLIRNTLLKYNNLEPDFTDAVLVTLAELHNIKRILTVDVRDFSVYRFSDGGSFERLWI